MGRVWVLGKIRPGHMQDMSTTMCQRGMGLHRVRRDGWSLDSRISLLPSPHAPSRAALHAPWHCCVRARCSARTARISRARAVPHNKRVHNNAPPLRCLHRARAHWQALPLVPPAHAHVPGVTQAAATSSALLLTSTHSQQRGHTRSRLLSSRGPGTRQQSSTAHTPRILRTLGVSASCSSMFPRAAERPAPALRHGGPDVVQLRGRTRGRHTLRAGTADLPRHARGLAAPQPVHARHPRDNIGGR